MITNKPILYRHYKNKLYKYLGLATHSETLEEMVLYKPLYENSVSDLWVRPKSMFHENINLNGKSVPRFEPVQFKYQSLKNPDDKTKQNLILLSQSVLMNINEKDLDSTLAGKKNILLLMAFDEKKLIGFKLGYELNNNSFYSWLGGVHSAYRGFGIAYELMKQQHEWCDTMGYKSIETKTMNQWKDMLSLNIKNGFEITGTELNTKGELKILMRKKL
jgi:GNAT superfamily N-acetyltransferase